MTSRRRKREGQQTPIFVPPVNDTPVLPAAQVLVEEMDRVEMSTLIRSIIREELKVHMNELLLIP